MGSPQMQVSLRRPDIQDDVLGARPAGEAAVGSSALSAGRAWNTVTKFN